MDIEIKMPDVGSEKLEVTEILIKKNNKIKKEQSLIIVEGDKTSIEIPSPISGIVKKILIKIGDKVHTNQVIMLFYKNIDKIKKINNIYKEIVRVYVSEKIYKNFVKIENIFVKVNEFVKKNSFLFCIKEHLNIVKVISPFDCIIKSIKSKIGDKINKDSSVVILENYKEKNLQYVKNIDKIKNNIDNHNIYATPIIKKLAYEFNINLNDIKGTGRKQRIVRKDIENYIKNFQKNNKNKENTKMLEIDKENTKMLEIDKENTKMLEIDKENFKKFGDIEFIKLNNIKKISGKNLKKNWISIPHVTQFDYADITNLEKFRENQNNNFKKLNKNIKITLLPFLLKIISKALKKFKYFNSSLSNDKKTLILKKYFNIGIAVETKHGLLVPVIKDVDKKSIINIYKEMLIICEKARSGKINIEDMKGGCFTISNLGGIGGTSFTPIINSPEVAILGISKSIIKPVWNKDKFIPKLMLPLSLSYDHQVIDGSDGVRFINFIKEIILDMRLLLM